MSLVQAFQEALSGLVPTSKLDALVGQLKNVERNLELASTRRMRMGSLDLGAAEGIVIYNPDTGARTIELEPVGNAWFGADLDEPALTSLVIFSVDEEYNDQSISAGDVLLGDNSSGQPNLYWNKAGENLRIRSGQQTKIILNSGGDVLIGRNTAFASGTTLAIFNVAQTYNSESLNEGDILLGDNSTDKPNVRWNASTGSLNFRSGTTPKVRIDTDGNVLVGSNVQSPSTTAFAIFTGNQTYNSESVGDGDILIGVNSGSNANILWDKSTGRLLFRGGTTTGLYIDTSGGVVITTGGTVYDYNALTWKTSGGEQSAQISAITDVPSVLYIDAAYNGATRAAEMRLTAHGGSSYDGYIGLNAKGQGNQMKLELNATTSPFAKLTGGDFYTDSWQSYYSYSTVNDFSSLTSTTLFYKKIGKLVFVAFQLGGASNGGNFTFTLPYSAANTVRFIIRCNNNSGSYTVGNGTLSGSSSTVTLYSDMGSTGWSSTNNKNAQGQFFYEAS